VVLLQAQRPSRGRASPKRKRKEDIETNIGQRKYARHGPIVAPAGR
jgi:hypothetical protein